ncbi:MAG TPA: carbon starvation protein A [Verrucomicrobiales bacterium]|nr:carbon starvation protein A [Verrucomicrobiales bacterium]
MQTLLIAILAGLGFIVAYHTYGRWLARRLFRLDPGAETPSVQINDDHDYVPTAKSIVFGHHFTSIAGTGPIVGPALAIMWGWLPALLWVVFGSILIGAVHDLGTLVVSLRNRGMTVGEIAGRVINPRARLLFLFILLFALWVVLAIFGLVIANVFVAFPESILPVFLQIPIAVWIGLKVHRRGGSLLWPSVIALGLMYLTVWFGAGCPGMEWTGGWLGSSIQSLNAVLASWPVWVWAAILLAYCYVASVMPVWVLLQPRDYINSLQLISALGLIVLGLAVAAFAGGAPLPGETVRPALALAAPAVNANPLNAPSMLPFLFVTIACGAISGFHCLVSSGTSSKQLKCETDAHFVGYGSMLTEGFLATLVIISVAAGIGMGWPAEFGNLTGSALWHQVYGDWLTVANTALSAFVVGCANLIKALGVDPTMAKALVGVLVASFAGTTLDTATRLQRYVVQELAATFAPKVSPTAMAAEGYDLEFEKGRMVKSRSWNPLTWLTNAHGATLFAVTTAFALALFPKPGDPWSWATIGKGGLILWPLFGATNQLLAGLAFLVVTFWLWRRKLPIWSTALPMVFMLLMPAWALMSDVARWWSKGQFVLVGVAALMLALEFWMIIEALLLWPKARGVMEKALPPLPPKAAGKLAGGSATC